jgi:hypothetical protein
MPDRFHEMIRRVIATGEITHHDVIPEDFGQAPQRSQGFMACLSVLFRAHPKLEVKLIGSRPALGKLALLPGSEIVVHGRTIRVSEGRTDRIGAVRLQFARAS